MTEEVIKTILSVAGSILVVAIGPVILLFRSWRKDKADAQQAEQQVGLLASDSVQKAFAVYVELIADLTARMQDCMIEKAVFLTLLQQHNIEIPGKGNSQWRNNHEL